MKQYVCSICGYIYDEEKNGRWEDLPDDWKCPICRAGKDAFRLKEQKTEDAAKLPKPEVERELSPMEMSIICSNLARGCEKQYLPEQSEDFKKLAEFFRSKAKPIEETGTEELLALVNKDLEERYPYGNAVAGREHDRGALRALTCSRCSPVTKQKAIKCLRIPAFMSAVSAALSMSEMNRRHFARSAKYRHGNLKKQKGGQTDE